MSFDFSLKVVSFKRIGYYLLEEVFSLGITKCDPHQYFDSHFHYRATLGNYLSPGTAHRRRQFVV